MKWFKKLFILLVASLLSLSTLSPLPTFAQETPQDAGSFYDDVPQARNTLLGAAQYFHIFAEVANVGSHTNGNVAVKELRGQADIGTKGYNKMEYHYIQNFSFLNSGSFPTRSNTKAVFGKNVNINIDNTNRPIINGNALDRITSNEVFQDKGNNEYINFEQEFKKLENSSYSILTSSIDETFSHSDFPDQNRRIIDIADYEGPIVHIHLNADVLKHNTPLYIKNLKTINDSDYKFVYISVDTNSSSSYNVLSPIKLEYENGSHREPHEATNFDDGSLLWTFGNGSQPFSGNINLNEIWQGSILAPRASVTSGKNIDGSIIVKEFTGQGETHRWDPQNRYGGVKLIKTDSTDASYFLEGAEFSLYNSKNQLIESGLKTNNNGELFVTNLDLGDYYFIETKAPDGYELSTEKHHFTIKSDTVLATVSLSVENTKEEVP
ncbi:MAG: SpaA isopeptide-forming pilin-related protein, partial [Erysipelothrix sp.]